MNNMNTLDPFYVAWDLEKDKKESEQIMRKKHKSILSEDIAALSAIVDHYKKEKKNWMLVKDILQFLNEYNIQSKGDTDVSRFYLNGNNGWSPYIAGIFNTFTRGGNGSRML